MTKKNKTIFESFNKLLNKLYEKTETRKRTEKISNMKLPQLFANANKYGVQIWKRLQDASHHVHHIRDENDIIESKGHQRRLAMTKQTICQKKETGFEGFNKLQKYFYKMTELRERREKIEQNQPQTFANAVSCCIQFWQVFQVANPHVHQSKDENEFKETKIQQRTPVMTKEDTVCR